MTVALSPPVIRIRPAPALEPPTDTDRRSDDHPTCRGQLALFAFRHLDPPETWQPGYGGAALVPVAGDGRLRRRSTGRPPAHRPAAATGTGAQDRPAISATGRRDGNGATVAANRFMTTCVEVLNGFRPVAQLRNLTMPLDYGRVSSQLTRRATRLRTGHGGRVILRRVLVSEPT